MSASDWFCVGIGAATFGFLTMTGDPGPPPVVPPVRDTPPAIVSKVSMGKLSGRGVLTSTANIYGQFWLDGSANGVAVRFLVDTGASDIAFSLRSARMLGIDTRALVFDGRAATANGVARVAFARMARLSLGPFTVTDVPVSIIDGEMDFPLLGMAFLRRMNVGIGNGKLTLRGPGAG
jgi:clan AA aspartic protease (TIGR02281 family)